MKRVHNGPVRLIPASGGSLRGIILPPETLNCFKIVWEGAGVSLSSNTRLGSLEPRICKVVSNHLRRLGLPRCWVIDGPKLNGFVSDPGLSLSVTVVTPRKGLPEHTAGACGSATWCYLGVLPSWIHRLSTHGNAPFATSSPKTPTGEQSIGFGSPPEILGSPPSNGTSAAKNSTKTYWSAQVETPTSSTSSQGTIRRIKPALLRSSATFLDQKENTSHTKDSKRSAMDVSAPQSSRLSQLLSPTSTSLSSPTSHPTTDDSLPTDGVSSESPPTKGPLFTTLREDFQKWADERWMDKTTTPWDSAR